MKKKFVVMVVAMFTAMSVMACGGADTQATTESASVAKVVVQNADDENNAKLFAGGEAQANGKNVSESASLRPYLMDVAKKAGRAGNGSAIHGEKTTELTVLGEWDDLIYRETGAITASAEDGFWCEIARVYELDKNGERIMGSLTTRAEDFEWLDCQLESGKTYELEIDVFNDCEEDFDETLAVGIAMGVNNDFDWEPSFAVEMCHEQEMPDGRRLEILDASDVVRCKHSADAGQIIPSEVYRIGTKGEESEHRWQIGEQLAGAAKVCVLSDSVTIPETSAQTIVVRFQVK